VVIFNFISCFNYYVKKFTFDLDPHQYGAIVSGYLDRSAFTFTPLLLDSWFRKWIKSHQWAEIT